MVLEKTLESLLDSKKIKPVNPKKNQPWLFIGRTDTEAPKFWPPDGKNWLTGKDTDAAKHWGQEKKGVIEDEVCGWHRWLNGHEFEQTLGDGEGQASWRGAVHEVSKNQTQFSNWATTIYKYTIYLSILYLYHIFIDVYI